MDFLPIFKIHILKYNTNDELYIFLENKNKNVNLTELYNENNSNPIFNNIFTEQEKETIRSENINVIFVDNLIFNDDNILMIKFKIKKYIFKNNISINELYLFGKYQLKENIDSLFDVNDSYNKNDIETILKNYNLSYEDVLEENINYNYDNLVDIITKSINSNINKNDNINILKNICLHSFFKNKSINYPINPFDLTYFPQDAISNFNDNYLTNHKIILFDIYDNLYNNTIYCITSIDFINYVNENMKEKIQEPDLSHIIKIYYPILFDNDIYIDSNEDYKIKIIKVREEDTLDLSNIDSIIHLQNSIYSSVEKSFLNILNTDEGIIKIQAIVNPIIKTNISLDQVFKKLSASESFPFIKYNPGKNQENIFRLYSISSNTKGKKIPYLHKSLIFKIDKRANKNKSIVFYLKNDMDLIIYFELMTDSTVYVTIENEKQYIDNELLKTICIKTINDYIRFIEPYFGIVHKVYNNILNLDQDNINIFNTDYILNYKITKKFNINKYFKCFSPFFNLIQNNINKGGIKMRYKRISNFNEMESRDAFINELLSQNKSNTEIIEQIALNFDLNEISARQIFITYLNENEIEQDIGIKLSKKI